LIEILQASSDAGADLLLSLVQHTIREVLEEELTAFLNAEPYARTEGRKGYRNACRRPTHPGKRPAFPTFPQPCYRTVIIRRDGNLQNIWDLTFQKHYKFVRKRKKCNYWSQLQKSKQLYDKQK